MHVHVRVHLFVGACMRGRLVVMHNHSIHSGTYNRPAGRDYSLQLRICDEMASKKLRFLADEPESGDELFGEDDAKAPLMNFFGTRAMC